MNKLVKVVALGVVALFPLVAGAITPPAAAPAADEPAAAEPAGPKLHPQIGPVKIPLGHALTLDLPAEHLFLAAAEAKPLLEKGGNYFDEGFIGVVFPKDNETQKWWIAIEYRDEGYIKDDDKLDADEILKSIKEGNEQANERRKQEGQPELLVDGWSEPPHYDKAQHHLVWAILGHDTQGKSVNYNTRILGRKGLVSINLITDPSTLATDKPEVEKILKNTSFDKGARYADFDSKTDKVAEYGLAALVAGGAGAVALKLAKVGILAKFGKVILGAIIALKKAFILLVLAIVGFFKKLFGVKDKTPTAPPSMVNQVGDPPASPHDAPASHDHDHDPNDPSGGSAPPA